MITGDAEWSRLITASKVAAILGVSPWESPRSCWHAMHGDLPAREQTATMSRGHYLEPAILSWWRDQHGVLAGEYKEQPEYRLGDWASVTPDMVTHVAEYDHENVLVEAKSAAYDDEWGDPGTDAIPAYYLAQVYFQMHVSGVHRCYVPVIFGRGLKFAEYVVDYDPAIGADLEARMRAFYDSLTADEPPPLDDSVATYDAIRKVHPEIDAKAEVELTADEGRTFLSAIVAAENHEANAREWKSTVLERMGRANYAVAAGVKVARRQPSGKGVAFYPLPKNLSLLTDVEATA